MPGYTRLMTDPSKLFMIDGLGERASMRVPTS